MHGDEDLFKYYPELEDALVWVYFHSSMPEFNKVECWGPLKEASAPSGRPATIEKNPNDENDILGLDTLQPCPQDCSCCFPPISSIPWAHQLDSSPSQSLDQGSLLSHEP